MALHSAPAFAGDVCNNADLEGAYVYSSVYRVSYPYAAALRTGGHLGQNNFGWKRKLSGTGGGSVVGNTLPIPDHRKLFDR